MTFTTLSDAINPTQTSLCVANAAGIRGQHRLHTPDTILLIDREYILVLGEPTDTPPVMTLPAIVRGYEGSVASAHAKGATVQIGQPSDFPTSGISPHKKA